MCVKQYTTVTSYFIFTKYVCVRACKSRHPIARLFDDLTDRMENRRENRAVGAHNRTIGGDFKESDGIGRAVGTKNRMGSEQT